MSVHAIEKALWQIYLNPADAERYKADPQAFANEFKLDDGERADLAALDVMGMQNRGTNPLLVMMAFQTIHTPAKLREYFGIVNQ